MGDLRILPRDKISYGKLFQPQVKAVVLKFLLISTSSMEQETRKSCYWKVQRCNHKSYGHLFSLVFSINLLLLCSFLILASAYALIHQIADISSFHFFQKSLFTAIGQRICPRSQKRNVKPLVRRDVYLKPEEQRFLLAVLASLLPKNSCTELRLSTVFIFKYIYCLMLALLFFMTMHMCFITRTLGRCVSCNST